MWIDHPQHFGNDDGNAVDATDNRPILIPDDASHAQEGVPDDVSPASEGANDHYKPPHCRRQQRDQDQPRWKRDSDGRLCRYDFAKMKPSEFKGMKVNMSRHKKRKYYASLCASEPVRVYKLSRKRQK